MNLLAPGFSSPFFAFLCLLLKQRHLVGKLFYCEIHIIKICHFPAFIADFC